MVEEGPSKSSSDFNQKESDAYPSLYQESAARKTEDKTIIILEGRCVGGSTTVNWTSSFRTPLSTLKFWQDSFGLAGYNAEELAPFFLQTEKRFNFEPWLTAPNENNALLRCGAVKLGFEASPLSRNVRACQNLGSCGLGCPTNAKQSMLVTTIPAALDRGAQLLTKTRAERFELGAGAPAGQVSAFQCRALEPNLALAHAEYSQRAIKIIARHYVLAGGAVDFPAVLLRPVPAIAWVRVLSCIR